MDSLRKDMRQPGRGSLCGDPLSCPRNPRNGGFNQKDVEWSLASGWR